MEVMTAPAPAATPTGTATPTDPTAPVAPDFATLLAGLVPTAGPTPPTPPTSPAPAAGPGAPKDDDKSSEKSSENETPAEESPGDIALAAVLVVPVPPPAAAAAPDAPTPTGTTGPTDTEPAPATPATTAVPALPATPTTPTTPTAPMAPTAPVLPSVAAPAPALVASPTPAATPAPVSRQLFDRVEKLATSTVSGSHRMTVRLDPGTLGEVRVHLSVRAGQVTVRLSAGSEARAALTEGAPQLQRLLEGAKGAGAHVTVAVHDLPAAHPTHLAATHLAATGAAGADLLRPADTGPGNSTGNSTGNSAGNQPGDQPASQHQPDLLDARAGGEWTGAGTGRSGDPGAHAGTRRATTARDGDQDRVTGPASAEPSTTGPRRGVDVRM